MNMFESIGLIAVIASLLFVAYELRLSNRIAVRDSRSNLLKAWMEVDRTQYENKEVASLLNKLRRPSQDLTEEERIRADGLATLYMSTCGLVNSVYDTRMLPENFLHIHMNILSMHINRYPGIAPFLADGLEKVGIKPGFARTYDQIFEEITKTEDGR